MAPDGSDTALTPVPTNARPFGFADCFALWSSLGVGLLVLQAGALLVPGLSLGTALAAIIIGSLIGVVLLALVGVIGSDSGLPTMAALRPTLGVRGSALPTMVNLVQLVGWGAFEIIVMRDSTDTIVQHLGGPALPIVWTLLWGSAATLLAFGGPLAFVRRFLKRWGIWLVYASALWLTIQLLRLQDLRTLFAESGSGALTFGLGLDLVVAMPLSWLPLIADYTRFGRRASAIFWGTALGYFAANVWFYALGALYTRVLPATDLLQTIVLVSGGLVALLLILIDETDNAFADIYSAAVTTGNLLPQLSTAQLALGYGALCTACALFVPIGQYQTFLLLLGSVFAPLFGIALVDHFMIRRRKLVLADLTLRDGIYWYLGGWNGTALIAWVAGIAVFQLITAYLPNLGATLPSLLVAGLLYFLLAAVWRMAQARLPTSNQA